LGSAAIEAAGDHAIDSFVRSILRSSPTAVPIVNLALKGGLSYGIYELRRTRMNWPYKGASPLLFEGFRAGLTFDF
jgi:hypothetical protein